MSPFLFQKDETLIDSNLKRDHLNCRIAKSITTITTQLTTDLNCQYNVFVPKQNIYDSRHLRLVFIETDREYYCLELSNSSCEVHARYVFQNSDSDTLPPHPLPPTNPYKNFLDRQHYCLECSNSLCEVHARYVFQNSDTTFTTSTRRWAGKK